MSDKNEKSFGQRVRELRQEKRISLRKFAVMVGLSPAYLSRIERDDCKPPVEELVRAIAEELDQDTDEFLALADRLAKDLDEIVKAQPRGMATFLRAAAGLSAEDLRDLAEQARKRKQSG
jgi:transcriptional regulator with XRE-family HTH domain